MSNDNSLRDIWSVTDKMFVDVLRSIGGVPESCNASVITTASSREKCQSYVSNPTQESYLRNNFGEQPISCGLFLHPQKEKVDEDDTMSLISSIWTPTIKDECVVRRDYQQNPLLVVKIPGKNVQRTVNKNPIPAEVPCENLISLSSEIPTEVPCENLISLSSKIPAKVPYENLISLSSEIPAEVPCDNLISLSSESELSNNCGSDESQDEHNEKTFGESNLVKSEMTMSNISKATAKYEVLEKKFQNEKHRKNESESSDSDHSGGTIIEKNNDTHAKNGPNTCFTKVNSHTQTRKSKVKIPPKKNHPKRRRNIDTKALSSKFFHLGMESDEVLSVSRENLTIQELHSSSRNSGRTSNVKKNIAIETREVMGKKGTTKKVTYVRGKIVEETNGCPNKNLKWNTDLCSIKLPNRNVAFQDNSFAFKKAPQNKLIEANSNQLYNSKDIRSSTYRQVKNGRLVFDDCLKMNGHLNFARQDRREIFKTPRKNFDMMKKNALYEPKYKSECNDYLDNRHLTVPKNILPNYPAKVTKSAHLERKTLNATPNYRDCFEDDACSKLSWKVITPEEEIENETTVKKHFVRETPVQTGLENLSKSCQTNLELNQVKKIDQVAKFLHNDKSEGRLCDRFIFLENLGNGKKEEETEILGKFVPKSSTVDKVNEFRIRENLSFARSAKLKEERAQKKSLLIKDGKEVADLIVGCHTAMDVFSSFYHEWLALREESINLLEKIMVVIMRCDKNKEKIRDVIAGLNIAASAAGYIPHKGISLGSRIAAAVGGFVAKLFYGNEFSEKDKNAKEFEVRQTFQKDIDTSSMVYIYGVQCSSQFEETCHAIKVLHQRTQQDNIDLLMSDTNVIKFLKEISEYNPSNVTVFYKRLRIEYERLIEDSKSDESRAFIRVFEVVPQAVPVIDLLPWKFEPDGFDNSIVMNAWEELFTLFNNNSLSSNDEFLRRVQNCLFFLKKEKALLRRTVQSLLK